MTPEQFIARWKNNPLTERAGAQAHFDDLCDLLGVDKPRDPDNYCFERGASKASGGDGWADVWRRGHFAWENKKPGKDLGKALKQLMTYALALDNPPLLVVSDREIIQIHTHFTGTPSETHIILLDDIGHPENLEKLRWLFESPERFRPDRTVAEITAEAAGRFADIAATLAGRGFASERIAHFLIQCLFCMFAEDVRLLPERLFERLLERRRGAGLAELFQAMQAGGAFGIDEIPWFNGGLFATIDPLPLEAAELDALYRASRMNWSQIEPSIFGTLFERGLNPGLRAQLGAHYTDPATIMKLICPAVVAPLETEWATVRQRLAELAPGFKMVATRGKGRSRPNDVMQQGYALFHGYLEKLKNFRVLDPACGSGNFLYLALKSLKDLEHRVNLDAEALGLQRAVGIETSPANVLGIEINGYAAELARVTVWIGEIQWMLNHGYPIRRNPILQALDHVECRDALLKVSHGGTPIEADWPACDAIVGNPPFLGDKKMRGELGDEYVTRLRKCYEGRVPGGADFVTYWFEKARAQIENGKCRAAGLVATNSIRGGASRKVLDRILETIRIFEAWSDEDWINEGAAVRVSLVCFGMSEGPEWLDGQEVDTINSDLTAGNDGKTEDLTQAHRLAENAGVSFMGVTKSGPFDVPANLAQRWLTLPNPHGRSNSDVLSPSLNGQDLAKRPSDEWIIHFGSLSEEEASLYEGPFSYAQEHIKPARQVSRTPKNREIWWRFERSRPEMFAAFGAQRRYIATCLVAKHRFFVWVHRRVVPENVVIVIARADDTTFGILHSRFHERWSLRLGTSLEDRPRYTPTTTFETFPFPAGMTPRDTAPGAGKESPPCMAPQVTAANIAAAARRLNELRENWLNPPEWTERIPEVVPGYPDRIVAKPGFDADLKKRTLTNLYNARPAWLDNAHKALDQAVAAAYGWTDYTPGMPDEEILRRLLALNLERKAAEASAGVSP
jgi:type II restriction/modification system DNA methylase subunit YeeA